MGIVKDVFLNQNTILNNIKFYAELINNSLKDLSFSDSPKTLYDPIKYIIEIGGKRIRPFLVLMSAESFGGNYRDALNAALSVECFHNFTLMHDDIMDSADLRRGNDTVHIKWDINQSILSGDALLIYSYNLLEGYDPITYKKLNNVLNTVALQVCEGQQLDLDFEKSSNVLFEDYINMIKLKTAVLIACSLKMGAITAGASKIDSQLIYDFGIIIGLAFQIKDDFLDVYGDVKSFGKKIGGDILENKKTILFHNAYSKTSNQNKTLLKKYFSDSNEGSTETKINIVKKIYTDSGAKSATKNLIKDYLKQAKRKINDISIQNKKKNLLLDFVDNYISFKI